MSIRDVEGTVRTFNGSGGYPIETWVDDFEDNAKLFKWSEMQKLLFAKKTLKGLASLFVKREWGTSSWIRLKSLLLEEFSNKLDSADLHEELHRRQIKKDASPQEYF